MEELPGRTMSQWESTDDFPNFIGASCTVHDTRNALLCSSSVVINGQYCFVYTHWGDYLFTINVNELARLKSSLS